MLGGSQILRVIAYNSLGVHVVQFHHLSLLIPGGKKNEYLVELQQYTSVLYTHTHAHSCTPTLVHTHTRAHTLMHTHTHIPVVQLVPVDLIPLSLLSLRHDHCCHRHQVLQPVPSGHFYQVDQVHRPYPSDQ